ncbi:MAG: FAD-dependent oxidoreductase [Sedimentisphaerales bacterium]|nr:FAD-dependent oxidoreductase [Sedimentisphaerales bacterium]
MAKLAGFNKVEVLVVGAGPAGLAAAITIKKRQPEIGVCVIDKAEHAGNHNLSGAVIEPGPLHALLDMALGQWQESERAQDVLGHVVEKDKVLMFLGKKLAFSMMPSIQMARLFRLGFGKMVHKGDYSVSISKLTAWLSDIAKEVGVEVLHGFAAADIIMNGDGSDAIATGVKLVDQGRGHDGKAQANFMEGEVINAEVIILAEGCDGLVTERFVEEAKLTRETAQLYSVGVKEMIAVSDEQYEKFGSNRCVHAMGYPLWTPLRGPGMFGGGIMYTHKKNHITVGMIVGADWKYHDFNPQDALARFKEHSYVKRYIEGGEVVEAGAKMIPEGGYRAVPRDPATNYIGKNNVIIVGDAAGFVDMLRIKGLHNAISSGMTAGMAVAAHFSFPEEIAMRYTRMLEESRVHRDMRAARNFRQTVAKFGNSLGFPLSVAANWLPKFNIEPDYETMTKASYRFKREKAFDKDAFTAAARVEHREEQPGHIKIIDPEICYNICPDNYDCPCIVFCPAGVYERIHDEARPANPSNCLHCKTCQNKCPYDNIRWGVPEGGGGPRYKDM